MTRLRTWFVACTCTLLLFACSDGGTDERVDGVGDGTTQAPAAEGARADAPSTTDGAPPEATAGPPDVIEGDATSFELASSIRAVRPNGMVEADGYLWVGGQVGVTKIDATAYEHVDASASLATALDLVFDGTSLWATEPKYDAISRFDVATMKLGESVSVGEDPGYLTFGKGSIWVANRSSGSVSRVDPAIAEEVEEIPLGERVEDIVYGDGFVWVSGETDAEPMIWQIDADTGAVAAAHVLTPTDVSPLDPSPKHLAFGDDAVWISDTITEQIIRLDLETGAQSALQIDSPGQLEFGFESIWVTGGGGYTGNARGKAPGFLARIDPNASRVEKLELSGHPRWLTIGAENIWVAGDSDLVHRITLK